MSKIYISLKKKKKAVILLKASQTDHKEIIRKKKNKKTNWSQRKAAVQLEERSTHQHVVVSLS